MARFSSGASVRLPRRTTAPASPRGRFGAFPLVVEPKGRVLRPTPRPPVPVHIDVPDYVRNRTGLPELSGALELKSPRDVDLMRNATRLAAEALQVASKMIRPGVTTDEIDSAVYDAIIAGKGYPSPLGYMGFPNSICTSVSNVMVHGIPDDRPLESGDLINVDVTVFHSGFHGDTSATFLVGDVDSEGRRLVEVTHEALRRAIAVCGPGTPFSLIGKTISILARKEGYTVSKSYCGHGIGRSFHELPLVYHHYNEDDGVMEEGMTFTIEPLLCQGSDAEVKWGDGWTVASQDGGRSAQFEHTVLITSDGASVMTL